ncbi:LuxR C-terminal-related transcriptional regulator [Telmatospirillum sp. J64-1]|uniref:LuxR C-terminal-related transcriptional regulator n=1 Tax=Telmatospirillum sp. J64-1 TaxID=2502183 RepID=UPI00115C9591|nr:LuxR C-terminal-related transcriptional regulator [Telmatospirillum sp. J64-1]
MSVSRPSLPYGGSRAILATKLKPPVSESRLVSRPRVEALLPGRGRQARLVVVSAPAGAGKTTLLARWHDAADGAAWLSLDAGDDDASTFFAHLIWSVRESHPGLGAQALSLLETASEAAVGDAVPLFANDLLSLGRPLTLFLDDYHVITQGRIHQLLDHFIAYLPANVMVVIGSRNEPPLSLARLRSRGQLVELRWPELRFTAKEASQYLRAAQALSLSDESVGRLTERSEGWITGLQLAALLLRGGGDPAAFVEDFSGSQAELADYLMDEVFSRQPEQMRDFLLRSSVLESLSGPLVEAVTGLPAGQRMLEMVERGNLFLFRLDQNRRWFRYHHLFRQFLRDRLDEEQPQLVAELHRRASLWFEDAGMVIEAMGHAMAGGFHERAATLLSSVGRDWFRAGGFKQIRQWIDRLPQELMLRRPRLCILHGWSLAYLGEFDAARRRMAEAQAGLEAMGDAAEGLAGIVPLAVELKILKAVMGVIESDEPDVEEDIGDLAALVPDEDAAMRGFAHIIMGYVMRSRGRFDEAQRHFHCAVEDSARVESAMVNLLARFNIGTLLFLKAEMAEAEAYLRASLAYSEEKRWTHCIASAFLHVQLGAVLHEYNRIEEGLEHLGTAIPILENSDAFGFLGVGLVERSRLFAAAARADRASQDLDRARGLARRLAVSRVVFRADVLEALAALDAGDVARAERAVERLRAATRAEKAPPGDGLSEKAELAMMAEIRLAAVQGQHQQAIRLAAEALRSASKAQRNRHALIFLAMQAASWWALGEDGRALDKMAQALGRAKGLARLFLMAGPDAVRLLKRLASGKGAPTPAIQAEASRILADLRIGRGESRLKPQPASPLRDFHQREVQILRLVAEGLKNREIAQRLNISDETVKWYLKGLYGKLDVSSRTQALAAARGLGLLE